MAATGYTPISLYHSTTPSQVPGAGSLVNGELALNIADMKLYAKNSSGVVTVLADSAVTGTVTSVSTGTGLTGGPITTTGTVSVATNGITNDLIRQSSGLSIVGRSSSTAGNVADITAGTDNQVLRRSGTSIGFGAVNVASTSAVTGQLTVGNGGTGRSTLTANNVILGNGSSAVNFVAPGTSGNILTSNGTTWTSAAPTGVTTGKAIAMAIVFG